MFISMRPEASNHQFQDADAIPWLINIKGMESSVVLPSVTKHGPNHVHTSVYDICATGKGVKVRHTYAENV